MNEQAENFERLARVVAAIEAAGGEVADIDVDLREVERGALGALMDEMSGTTPPKEPVLSFEVAARNVAAEGEDVPTTGDEATYECGGCNREVPVASLVVDDDGVARCPRCGTPVNAGPRGPRWETVAEDDSEQNERANVADTPDEDPRGADEVDA